MSKKISKSKRATAEEVVNVCGDYLPDEVAEIFHMYYEAFLKKGFTSEQAFSLTLLTAGFYLS